MQIKKKKSYFIFIFLLVFSLFGVSVNSAEISNLQQELAKLIKILDSGEPSISPKVNPKENIDCGRDNKGTVAKKKYVSANSLVVFDSTYIIRVRKWFAQCSKGLCYTVIMKIMKKDRFERGMLYVVFDIGNHNVHKGF